LHTELNNTTLCLPKKVIKIIVTVEDIDIQSSGVFKRWYTTWLKRQFPGFMFPQVEHIHQLEKVASQTTIR